MDEQNNNMRVLFTTTANSALDGIIRKFNLEETLEESDKKDAEGKPSNIVIIDHLSKSLSLGNISDKDLIVSLQKDLGVPQQTAEQISREIINNIIPFLEKVPVEKLKNPIFAEELIKKLSGITSDETKIVNTYKKTENIDDLMNSVEPMKNEEGMVVGNKPVGKDIILPKKPERFKKQNTTEKISEPVTNQTQPKRPDSYREPIE